MSNKVKIKKKLKPLDVSDGEDHLIKDLRVYHPNYGTVDLPRGTLVKRVTYYGPKGPRQASYSVDQGVSWRKGFHWGKLPLSEGTEIKYV